MKPTIRAATPADLDKIRGLLRAASLPDADIAPGTPIEFLVAESSGRTVGAIGLERFGGAALLRSLVVLPECRGTGLGGALVEALERLALARGVDTLVLLTTTAEPFFTARGYAPMSRSVLPEAVRASREFRSLCPDTAACLSRRLEAGVPPPRVGGATPAEMMENHAVIDRPFNVLFLCTGNAARSILSEAILNHRGAGRFRGFSAGSHPNGRVNPYALALLERMKLPTAGLRSKSWDEFAVPGAPPLHFVFTVCDNAAGEICPIWPGQPMTAHWGVPDPAAVEGTDLQKTEAFRDAYRVLDRRIELFTSLPFQSLDRLSLGRELRDIGKR